MVRITRAVAVEDLTPLLANPPRATLAYVRDGEVSAIPVRFQWVGGRFLVGLPREIEVPRGRVKLLVDDGPWYFDLRGIWARGTLEPSSVGGLSAQCDWVELRPEKTVAWHYGRMRDIP